ncbi:MAG TPA: hypothetical protein VK184_00035 [Nostocaceae cyanobacterium]|nr:hypothetical protein [Nostocaceae cyanobacterium]
MTDTQPTKSDKKRKNSVPGVNIGTPKVPLRKGKPKQQQRELLSDWEHAS